jgi:hypothetical protein
MDPAPSWVSHSAFLVLLASWTISMVLVATRPVAVHRVPIKGVTAAIVSLLSWWAPVLTLAPVTFDADETTATLTCRFGAMESAFGSGPSSPGSCKALSRQHAAAGGAIWVLTVLGVGAWVPGPWRSRRTSKASDRLLTK